MNKVCSFIYVMYIVLVIDSFNVIRRLNHLNSSQHRICSPTASMSHEQTVADVTTVSVEQNDSKVLSQQQTRRKWQGE